MLGPFLVTLFLAMLGIVAHVLRMAARKTRKAAHELGIDEKVHRVTCMHLHYNTTITTIIIAVVLLVLLLPVLLVLLVVIIFLHTQVLS